MNLFWDWWFRLRGYCVPDCFIEAVQCSFRVLGYKLDLGQRCKVIQNPKPKRQTFELRICTRLTPGNCLNCSICYYQLIFYFCVFKGQGANKGVKRKNILNFWPCNNESIIWFTSETNLTSSTSLFLPLYQSNH